MTYWHPPAPPPLKSTCSSFLFVENYIPTGLPHGRTPPLPSPLLPDLPSTLSLFFGQLATYTKGGWRLSKEKKCCIPTSYIMKKIGNLQSYFLNSMIYLKFWFKHEQNSINIEPVKPKYTSWIGYRLWAWKLHITIFFPFISILLFTNYILVNNK